MNLLKSRKGPRPLVPAKPADDHRQPANPIPEEMSLFGVASHDRENELDRVDLCSRPEAYFLCDRRHLTHEVL